jgi:hypothetical protein
MKNRLNHIVQLLNKELGLYLGIGFGVAFFIFIFKPFPLDHIDFDNRKIFILGVGVIVSLVIFLIRSVFPYVSNNNDQDIHGPVLRSGPGNLVIWALNIIAISVYLKFAGTISLSYYLFFKVFLISITPPLILAFYDKMSGLNRINEALIREGIIMQGRIDKYEGEHLNKSIEFITENKSETIRLLTGDILFFKSSDNYVEIHFLEGTQARKKLIRNTLNNIELQIKPFANFVRCHRNCIVNVYHIENTTSFNKNHALIMKGPGEQIPVSRQYLLKIKEAL